MNYEVTIGIPVYRAVDYIKQTMESALNQTYPDIEYLVLDDCGKDGSMAIIEQLKEVHPRGKDIRILRHDENRGVGVSRNNILNEACGQYLFFLDSDDLIDSDTIATLLTYLKRYDAEAVFGSWERIDNVNHSPSQIFVYPFTKLLAPDALALYAFKNYSTFRISVCNCLMNVSFLRENGLQFIDTAFWEDLAFMYEMVAKAKRAVLLPEVTYHYLCRQGSLSNYQERGQLEKTEIQKNVATIDYLKSKCREMQGKTFLPFLCYNLEMNSFYIVCYVLKHFKQIVPQVSKYEMKQFMYPPLPFSNMAHFRKYRLPNLVLWVISSLPSSLLVPVIWILGKVKRIL